MHWAAVAWKEVARHKHEVSRMLEQPDEPRLLTRQVLRKGTKVIEGQ